MKLKLFSQMLILAFIVLNISINAQTLPALFKDLTLGTTNSNPEQLTNVNGTLYFIAIVGTNRNHQLWKSDGTAANTVMVKDSIIFSNIGGAVSIRGNINNTVFYTVNKSGATAGDTTRLWKTDGSTPELVAVLSHPGYPGIGGGYPTQFIVAGNKLFFTMWKDHGRELWVSNGTTAGTMEVIDLLPGSNGGVSDLPMIAFNDKVYFQGNTTLGNTELFSSDGTSGGTVLVKEIKTGNGGSNPKDWIVFNNFLFFGTDNGLWKTDGSTNVTVNVAATGFGKAVIFKNQLFFTIANKLWKSDGTTVGTIEVKDSIGSITGANSNYLITTYLKSLPVPPYYEYQYWKSDGTTDGTHRVSDSLGKSASFFVINNKMYNAVAGGAGFISGLWETDGTELGTKTLLASGYLTYPFVYKNIVFFTNWQSGSGYELWYYEGSTTSVDVNSVHQIPSIYILQQNYPNPFNPITTIQFDVYLSGATTLKVYDVVGREVSTLVNGNLNAGKYNVRFDASTLSSGVYFYRLHSGSFLETKKMVLVK